MGCQVAAYMTWPDNLVSVAVAWPVVPNSHRVLMLELRRLQEEWAVDFGEDVACISLGLQHLPQRTAASRFSSSPINHP